MTRRQPANGTPMSGGLETLGLDPARMAQWAYASHSERCPTCSVGGLCSHGSDLLKDADAEDWRRALAQARAERAVGAGL
jgi:hypothetical protein